MEPQGTTLGTVVFAALLAGCATRSPGPALPPLEGTAWVLAALPGRSDVGGGDPPATVRFEHGRASGNDGCNRFIAPYTVKDGALDVPARAATTRMACPPDRVALAESFLRALTGARTYRIDGGRLQLLAFDGAVLATLDRQSQSLAGTSWRATAINNGKGAVASMVAGTTVTLAFGSDAQASGSAGCNRFTSRYVAEGSRVGFEATAATRRLCASPPGVMEQEAAFLKALQLVATARVEGNRLELRTADGALAVTLVRDGG